MKRGVIPVPKALYARIAEQCGFSRSAMDVEFEKYRQMVRDRRAVAAGKRKYAAKKKRLAAKDPARSVWINEGLRRGPPMTLDEVFVQELRELGAEPEPDPWAPVTPEELARYDAAVGHLLLGIYPSEPDEQ